MLTLRKVRAPPPQSRLLCTVSTRALTVLCVPQPKPSAFGWPRAPYQPPALADSKSSEYGSHDGFSKGNMALEISQGTPDLLWTSGLLPVTEAW
jgi:hypothetical protein